MNPDRTVCKSDRQPVTNRDLAHGLDDVFPILGSHDRESSAQRLLHTDCSKPIVKDGEQSFLVGYHPLRS